jgi:hypothetical protein
MFKSKIRNLTIPQAEHARLAGTIAYHWGNADIPPPAIDPVAFAAGVTTHDRGYGLLDTMGIGEVDEAVWLATQRRGVQMTDANPVTDTVALLHLRRLLSHGEGADVAALIALAEDRIARNIAQTDATRQQFDQADTITELCDNISFKFCFEEPTQFTGTVFAGDAPREIQVHVLDGGTVQLDPWPLSVPVLRGFILGYALNGYPDHLQPILIDYAIVPAQKG